MSDKHVVDVAAAIVVVVDVIVVVGLQTISRGLWRPHWDDGYCYRVEKDL